MVPTGSQRILNLAEIWMHPVKDKKNSHRQRRSVEMEYSVDENSFLFIAAQPGLAFLAITWQMSSIKYEEFFHGMRGAAYSSMEATR